MRRKESKRVKEDWTNKRKKEGTKERSQITPKIAFNHLLTGKLNYPVEELYTQESVRRHHTHTHRPHIHTHARTSIPASQLSCWRHNAAKPGWSSWLVTWRGTHHGRRPAKWFYWPSPADPYRLSWSGPPCHQTWAKQAKYPRWAYTTRSSQPNEKLIGLHDNISNNTTNKNNKHVFVQRCPLPLPCS